MPAEGVVAGLAKLARDALEPRQVDGVRDIRRPYSHAVADDRQPTMKAASDMDLDHPLAGAEEKADELPKLTPSE